MALGGEKSVQDADFVSPCPTPIPHAELPAGMLEEVLGPGGWVRWDDVGWQGSPVGDRLG